MVEGQRAAAYLEGVRKPTRQEGTGDKVDFKGTSPVISVSCLPAVE